MEVDPIIEEIRKTRDQFAREVGYDVRALGRKLQKNQKARKSKVVSLTPKRAEEEATAQRKSRL